MSHLCRVSWFGYSPGAGNSGQKLLQELASSALRFTGFGGVRGKAEWSGNPGVSGEKSELYITRVRPLSQPCHCKDRKGIRICRGLVFRGKIGDQNSREILSLGLVYLSLSGTTGNKVVPTGLGTKDPKWRKQFLDKKALEALVWGGSGGYLFLPSSSSYGNISL